MPGPPWQNRGPSVKVMALELLHRHPAAAVFHTLQRLGAPTWTYAEPLVLTSVTSREELEDRIVFSSVKGWPTGVGIGKERLILCPGGRNLSPG